MKVESAEVLGALLSRRAIFEVPIFQRKYSWEKPECKSLLEDIRAMVEKGPSARHFINALIYKNYSNSAVPSVVAHFTIIDGQQRLTTIMLILKNLELIAPKESDCYSEICAMLYEGGQNRPRLRLKSEDTEQFASILKASSEQDLEALSAQKKSNLIANFLLIREFMLEMSKEFSNAYERIYAAILKIYAVCICLEENDNAQEIFQSINSNGKLLSQADLIRNFILLGLSEAEQKRIYENYWKKLERESYDKNCKLDEFFRRYLRFRISTSVTGNQVYSAFADYAQELGDLDALLTDVMKFFDLYSLFYGADKKLAGVSKQAKIHLQMFADMGFTTVSSYIFAIYEAGHTPQDFNEILRLLLVDTIRKKFADPEKSRRFEIFYDSLRSSLKSAEKSQYVAALREQLKRQYGAKGKNPLSDKEFEKAIIAANFDGFFNKSFAKAILFALENYQTAEQVAMKEEISIEHIMPQTPSPWGISANDPKFLARLNSLGNLSLTAVNSQISNKPFNEKLTFYKDSKFTRLYEDVLSAKNWTYAAIDARTKALAKRLVQLFSFEDPASPPQFRPFCAQEFADNKIKAARFCGVQLQENTYKGVYLGIMQALLAAQPARMSALAAAGFKSAKNAKKPAISTNSDGMNSPTKLAEEIFLETCYSGAYYAKLIPAVLKAFSKAENDLQLLYE